MTRLECGGARLSASLSRLFVSRSLSLSLISFSRAPARSLSFSHTPPSRVAASSRRIFALLQEKKCISLCESSCIYRACEIRLLINRNGARASPFSLLYAPSRQSPIGSSLVITAATAMPVLPTLFLEIFTTLLSFSIMECAMVAERWSRARLAHCGLTRQSMLNEARALLPRVFFSWALFG